MRKGVKQGDIISIVIKLIGSTNYNITQLV